MYAITNFPIFFENFRKKVSKFSIDKTFFYYEVRFYSLNKIFVRIQHFYWGDYCSILSFTNIHES